jgi:hypothetical protein
MLPRCRQLEPGILAPEKESLSARLRVLKKLGDRAYDLVLFQTADASVMSVNLLHIFLFKIQPDSQHFLI